MSATITALKGSSEPVITLRQRIADALTTDTNSAELRSCIAHAQAELSRVDRESGAAHARAIDPLTSEEDANEAKRTLDGLRFDGDRLRASEIRLTQRLKEVEQAEREAERQARLAENDRRRSAFVEKFRRVWPRAAGELVELMGELKALEAEVGGVEVAINNGGVLNGSRDEWPILETLRIPKRYGLDKGWPAPLPQ